MAEAFICDMCGDTKEGRPYAFSRAGVTFCIEGHDVQLNADGILLSLNKREDPDLCYGCTVTVIKEWVKGL